MEATGILRWTWCPYHCRHSWHVLRQDGYLSCLWCLIMGNDKAIHLPAFHPPVSYVPAPSDIIVDPHRSKKVKECPHKTIRDWPDCYEDCDYAGTDECPHHNPQLHTRMQVVCAWCGKDMGEKDGKGQTGTTHSICPKCKEKEIAKIRKGQTH